MDNNKLSSPELKEYSWGEAFLQATHNAVSISSIPIISPAICSLLNLRIQSLGNKRFENFFVDVLEYINKANKMILESDEFAIATEMTIRKIVNEHNENKRKRFSKLYKDFIQKLHAKDKVVKVEDLEIFLSIANVLSDNALISLMMLKEFGLSEPFSSGKGEKFDEFNALVKQRYGDYYYHRAMAELEQAGVAKVSTSFWGKSITLVTNLGLEFLQWLETEEC